MKPAPDDAPCSRARRAGFTLVELLLATALLLLLVSAVAFSFSSTQVGSELVTGTERFESLIRYARAQAAYAGRRVQIRFDPSDPAPDGSALFKASLAWEPDPLSQPGVFDDLEQAGWDLGELNRLVGIREVYLPGTSLAESPDDEWAAPLTLDEPEPISFAPDGTSDSAHIRLAPRVEDDPRTVIIYLSGLTGAFHHEIQEPSAEPDAAEVTVEETVGP